MLAIRIVVLHLPSVIVADGLYDGKPQAVSFRLFRRTVETFEYHVAVKGGAVRSVGYRKFPVRYCHSDSSVGAVVPDRIHYEIVNEALQQGAVCLYARPGAAAFHPYADMPGQVFHELQHHALHYVLLQVKSRDRLPLSPALSPCRLWNPS